MKAYFAITVQENGKYYSYAETIKSGENVLHTLTKIKGAITAEVCPTRIQAERLAEKWNDSARANHNYLFD